MKSQIFCLTASLYLVPVGCVQLGKTASTSQSLDAATVIVADHSDSVEQFQLDHTDTPTVAPVAFTQFQEKVSGNDGLTLEPVVIPQFGRMQSVDEVGYTLADVEQMALANNPAIAAAGSTVSKAAGLRQQVGMRPNPTLGYFGQQIADRNTDQHGLFVQQEFVRGNKLELNRNVLGHTQKAQQAEIETQRYRVLTDVRVRFFEAVAAQRQHEITTEFAQTARQAVEVAEQRQAADEGTMIDTLQSQTLLSEVTLAAEQAEVKYRGAWRDLVFEKQALLKRQQVQNVPNVTAQLGAGYDDATDHGMLNLQLSAPIPVWNNNNGNISAAYSDYVRATQNVQRIEQSIRSRLV